MTRNITDYGAFVELERRASRGWIHVLRNVLDQEERPSRQDHLDELQEVEVQVVRGGSGQAAGSCSVSSWVTLQVIRGKRSPRNIRSGSTVEGEVARTRPNSACSSASTATSTAWCISSDLDWSRPGEQVIDEFKKGDRVSARVLDVDVEKERIALGVKQLASDPFQQTKKLGEDASEGDLRKGSVVTCEVLEVKDGGIEVKLLGTDLAAFIKRAELARDRGDQRPERFSVGEKVDALHWDPAPRPSRPQARRGVDSRRWKWPRRKRRSLHMHGPADLGRLARRHPGRGSQGAREEVRLRSPSAD